MSPTGAATGLMNAEGIPDYDITWPWLRETGLRPGATAVVPALEETRCIPSLLPALLRSCDAVLVVDDGSGAGPDLAQPIADRAGLGDRLTCLSYPFPLARGADHLDRSERSVHSVVYFRNWCLAQVTTRFSWTFPSTGALTTEGEASVGDVGWQVGHEDAVVRIPWHTLYVADERHGFLDLKRPSVWECGFPVGPDFVCAKAYDGGVRRTPPGVRGIRLPPGVGVRAIFLDRDDPEAPTGEGSATSGVRARQREVTRALSEGAVPPGGVCLTSPDARHIVEYAVTGWLPRAPRPLRPPESPPRSL